MSCRVLTFNRRYLSRLPDSVVSVSQHALAEHIKRQYLENLPTTVIHNIQSELKPPLLHTIESGHTSRDLVFGFIGRIEGYKGIETLLAATEQLSLSNWRLRIAGKGVDGYVDRLAKRFPDPRIEWLGFIDAENFYPSVDVVILPSLWAEPLPYVCVESLHAGRNLICASSGGIPEIARLSPLVEFFPAGDASALAEKMALALTSPQVWRAPNFPNASRLRVFQEEYVVTRYLQEYAEQNAAFSSR